MEKINLMKLVRDLNFSLLTNSPLTEIYPKSVYVSDLLSDVLSKANANMLWVTSQIHKNIIAVALLRKLSAIIIVKDHTPDEELIMQAEDKGVILISSGLSAYDTIGKLYNYMHE